MARRFTIQMFLFLLVVGGGSLFATDPAFGTSPVITVQSQSRAPSTPAIRTQSPSVQTQSPALTTGSRSQAPSAPAVRNVGSPSQGSQGSGSMSRTGGGTPSQPVGGSQGATTNRSSAGSSQLAPAGTAVKAPQGSPGGGKGQAPVPSTTVSGAAGNRSSGGSSTPVLLKSVSPGSGPSGSTSPPAVSIGGEISRSGGGSVAGAVESTKSSSVTRQNMAPPALLEMQVSSPKSVEKTAPSATSPKAGGAPNLTVAAPEGKAQSGQSTPARIDVSPAAPTGSPAGQVKGEGQNVYGLVAPSATVDTRGSPDYDPALAPRPLAGSQTLQATGVSPSVNSIQGVDSASSAPIRAGPGVLQRPSGTSATNSEPSATTSESPSSQPRTISPQDTKSLFEAVPVSVEQSTPELAASPSGMTASRGFAPAAVTDRKSVV